MSPEDLFEALHAKTGGKLFTVTVLDRAAGLARRVHTSHPETYPVSGTKPMAQGEWTVQVIERGEPFVANSVPEFARYFADHAVIEGLGCGAALNVPLGDPVAGTVNILDVAGYFTPTRVRDAIATIKAEEAALLAAFDAYALSL